MTEYDDDKAKLLRAKQEILRRYMKGVGVEPDVPDGLLIGPRSKEEFEQLLRDLADQDDNLEEDEDDHQTRNQ